MKREKKRRYLQEYKERERERVYEEKKKRAKETGKKPKEMKKRNQWEGEGNGRQECGKADDANAMKQNE